MQEELRAANLYYSGSDDKRAEVVTLNDEGDDMEVDIDMDVEVVEAEASTAGETKPKFAANSNISMAAIAERIRSWTVNKQQQFNAVEHELGRVASSLDENEEMARQLGESYPQLQ